MNQLHFHYEPLSTVLTWIGLDPTTIVNEYIADRPGSIWLTHDNYTVMIQSTNIDVCNNNFYLTCSFPYGIYKWLRVSDLQKLIK